LIFFVTNILLNSQQYYKYATQARKNLTFLLEIYTSHIKKSFWQKLYAHTVILLTMTTCNLAGGYQNSTITMEKINCSWTLISTYQADITVTKSRKIKRAALNAWRKGERRTSFGRLFQRIFSVLIGIEVLCLATGCDIGYVTLKCMVIDRLITRKGRRSDRSHFYGIMPIVIFNFLTSVERLWRNPNLRAIPVQ
jgi:hypothetical protein